MLSVELSKEGLANVAVAHHLGSSMNTPTADAARRALSDRIVTLLPNSAATPSIQSRFGN
jgi:hypothetical protein